jgi:hypothetical protein
VVNAPVLLDAPTGSLRGVGVVDPVVCVDVQHAQALEFTSCAAARAWLTEHVGLPVRVREADGEEIAAALEPTVQIGVW